MSIQIVVVTDTGGAGTIIASADTLRVAKRWVDRHVERMAKVGQPASIALWDTDARDWITSTETRTEV